MREFDNATVHVYMDAFGFTDTTVQVEDIKAKILLEVDADGHSFGSEELIIFANKDGIGYQHKVPCGYSEYTWWHEIEVHFYKTADLDWFERFALDNNLRDMLSKSNWSRIKRMYEENKKEWS